MNKIKLNIFDKNGETLLLPSIKNAFSQSVKSGSKEEIMYGDLYFSIHFKYTYCILTEIKEGGIDFFTLFLWENKDYYQNKVKNICNFNTYVNDLRNQESGYIYLGNIFTTPLKVIYKKLSLLYKTYSIDEDNILCDLGKNLFNIFHFKTETELNPFFMNEYRNTLYKLKVYFLEENFILPVEDILLYDRELIDAIKNNKIIYFVKLYYDFSFFDGYEYIPKLQVNNFEYGHLKVEEYVTIEQIDGYCIMDEYGSANLLDIKDNKFLIDSTESDCKGIMADFLQGRQYNIHKATINPTMDAVKSIMLQHL